MQPRAVFNIFIPPGKKSPPEHEDEALFHTLVIF